MSRSEAMPRADTAAEQGTHAAPRPGNGRRPGRTTGRERATPVARLHPLLTGGSDSVRRRALWVRAIRVRQWPKNVLVFAPAVAAGAIWHAAVLARVSVATLAFCLLSSGTYLINDVHDAAEDRRHPVKRHRPIAAGLIAPRRATAVAGACAAAGLGTLAALGPGVGAVGLAYIALNLAYTRRLRQVAIADIATIAAAFVIRALAGGVVADVAISRWFLVVVSFSALLVAAGKRYADTMEPGARASRAALSEYNPDFLRMVVSASLAVSLGAYCLWAFQSTAPATLGWREVTILPFTLALLRYLLLLSGGHGGAPEEIVLSDRFIQVNGALWLLAFLLGLAQ
jgi:decaprenyl-phosphate phosphoribosyltransferase